MISPEELREYLSVMKEFGCSGVQIIDGSGNQITVNGFVVEQVFTPETIKELDEDPIKKFREE